MLIKLVRACDEPLHCRPGQREPARHKVVENREVETALHAADEGSVEEEEG